MGHAKFVRSYMIGLSSFQYMQAIQHEDLARRNFLLFYDPDLRKGRSVVFARKKILDYPVTSMHLQATGADCRQLW
jgi:hypothetical protein